MGELLLLRLSDILKFSKVSALVHFLQTAAVNCPFENLGLVHFLYMKLE